VGGEYPFVTLDQKKKIGMSSYLPIVQIIIGVLLTVFVLLQQRGTALGSAFGGGEGNVYLTRRGIQTKLYWGTVVLGILFIVLALVRLTLGSPAS